MFRDRTNLYISYRRTFPHHLNKPNLKSSKLRLKDDEEELMGSNDTTNNIEMKTLPPSFIDIGEDIDTQLQIISNQVITLNNLTKKNLLPGFDDRTVDEEEIEKLNYQITSNFLKCNNLIKRFSYIKQSQQSLKQDDILMINNMEKNYALKIQSHSSTFRKIQNNYIKFLKKDEYSTSTTTSTIPLDELETESIEQYSRDVIQESNQVLHEQSTLNNVALRQREQEINKLAQGVLEVSAIFKEMQNLIIDQGTILDSIEYNLENAKVDLREGRKELDRAAGYQKRTQKCKIILLLSLVVTLLFFILILRPSHSTTTITKTVVEKPDTADSDQTVAVATTQEEEEEDTSAKGDFSIQITDPETDLRKFLLMN
ncbi:hypothetical protein WICPIJ_005372 [Wickerhamomyces pijperi]|uniref:t-SNARE coiled-coil homology domain-containing protein n=1 Tax=Wickerhamomyces pijperi TaxID=599730 RepID=A0A9P8TL78_WICPI|nr:hypothetical protein WICPIJ_005372 [Wickerhamomyces pijperi]